MEATAAGEALDRFWEAGEEEQSSVRRAAHAAKGWAHLCRGTPSGGTASGTWTLCPPPTMPPLLSSSSGPSSAALAPSVAAAAAAALVKGDGEIDDAFEGLYQRWERGPSTYGPARQVSAAPFAVVFGTQREQEEEEGENKSGGSGKELAAAAAAETEVGPQLSSSSSSNVSSNAYPGWLLRDLATYAANLHAMAADTFAPVLSDVQALAPSPLGGRGSVARNVIAVGTPFQNAFLASKVLHQQQKESSFAGAHKKAPTATSAVQWMRGGNGGGVEASFRIAGSPCGVFDEPGTAILYLAPWWDDGNNDDKKNHGGGGGEDARNASKAWPSPSPSPAVARLVLVAAGTDAAGAELALRLATPTIPPMTRAPFTNLVPDWVVLGPEARLAGYGGVRAAGFWGNRWQFDAAASYLNCAR